MLRQSEVQRSVNRRIELPDGGGVLVVDHALSGSEFESVSTAVHAAQFAAWRISDSSGHGLSDVVPCDYLQADFDTHDFLDSAAHPVARSLAREYAGVQPLKLSRVFANAFHFGDATYAHGDEIEGLPGVSVIFFVNRQWEPDWGGELIFFDGNHEARACVTPQPGRAVIFSNNILHRPNLPSRICPELRLTLNVRFATA